MPTPGSFLTNCELPRLAMLSPNLCAAAFPLMKLLPARHILAIATATELLKPGGHIVETTSGTFGLALALLSSVEKLKLTLISSPTLVDGLWRQRVEQLGADVQLVDDPNATATRPAAWQPSILSWRVSRIRSGRVSMTMSRIAGPTQDLRAKRFTSWGVLIA